MDQATQHGIEQLVAEMKAHVLATAVAGGSSRISQEHQSQP
jgi:hypothetical protein